MSNIFSFTGTVGRDCEVKQLESGQTVLNVTVANNIGFGERQQTLWIRVALWGKRAESKLADYLKKGQQVFVSGELTQREYQAGDGTTKTSLELNCNVIDLIGKRQETGPAISPLATGAAALPATNVNQDNSTPFDDEIPF